MSHEKIKNQNFPTGKEYKLAMGVVLLGLFMSVLAITLIEVYIYIKNTKLYLWQSQRYYIKYQMILNF